MLFNSKNDLCEFSSVVIVYICNVYCCVAIDNTSEYCKVIFLYINNLYYDLNRVKIMFAPSLLYFV
jgi:hypothetical protein